MNLRKMTRFLRKEDGTSAIEAVLVAPMLFVASCELVDLFLGFRMTGLSYRAAYSVADSVSRIGETAELDQAQLDDLHDLFKFLVKSDGDTAIRITIVERVTDSETGASRIQIKGSERSPTSIARVTDLEEIADHLPILGLADEVIITETFSSWEPAYIDIGTRDFHETIVSRPRFTQNVEWNDGSGTDVGWGGGNHDDGSDPVPET